MSRQKLEGREKTTRGAFAYETDCKSGHTVVHVHSMVDGAELKQELACTPWQLKAWASGALIQHAMPSLTPDQREFIMTGLTAHEFEDATSEDDFENLN